eukprot:2967734-Pleurochrysis_carterae.AAC.1
MAATCRAVWPRTVDLSTASAAEAPLESTASSSAETSLVRPAPDAAISSVIPSQPAVFSIAWTSASVCGGWRG